MCKLDGYIVTFAFAIAMALSGCTSPLKSDDPATRVKAVAELSDDKELFFVAMNVGVHIGMREGSYYNAFLAEENYADDVRVAAVKRLKNIDYLLCCAAWQDGDLYADSGLDQGRLEFKGENYYVHDSDSRLLVKVKPGEAVRSAAIARLKEPGIFRLVAKSLATAEGQEPIRKRLFPSGRRWTGSGWSDGKETSFVDYYGHVKKDNPLDKALGKAVEEQSSSEAIADFLLGAADNGPVVVPSAYAAAFKRLSGVASDTATRLFRGIFIRPRESVPDVFRTGAIKLYGMIDDPDTEIVMTTLRLASIGTAPNILGRVKRADVLVKVLCDKGIVDVVPRNERCELYCPLDVVKTDMRPEVAKSFVWEVKDSTALGRIATDAALFSIRLAAVEQLSDDRQLARIVLDPLTDCPFDTSLPKYDLISNRIDWWNRTERTSAMRLRKLAVSRMADATVLRHVRKSTDDDSIKSTVSARLAALGVSDVAEILAASKYDKDLFSVLNELNGRQDIERVAKEAKLKGVRVVAASKLPHDVCAALVQKECTMTSVRCPEGRIEVGGFFLGMDIEDALAQFVLCFPDVKPRFYLDGKVLCIAGENGRDMAWANAENREVHWLTLPPRIVQKIVGFKSGTFSELEAAVQSALKLNFRMNVVGKGEVRQQIGEVETVAGESLRYFRSEVRKGEDFKRSVRKSLREDIALADPVSGIGAALANAFEDAQQAEENASHAKLPRFAEQGSLQLQWTKNAVKGEY